MIVRFVERHGHEPSYQQIARQLGVSSKAGIQRHIVALENQGLIARKRENGSFSIELKLQKDAAGSVCLVELVEPAEAENGGLNFAWTRIALPRSIVGSLLPDEVLAFRVSDDSMCDKDICEGDLVLMERRNYARRGDTVAVLIKKKRMMLGQYHPQGPQTEIRPSNSDYAPVVASADQVAIQGVMRGLIRPIPDRSN
jgi:repressor LexA